MRTQPNTRLDRRKARVTARAIAEQRRHARASLPLAARMMRSDGRECICAVADISAGGLAATAEISPRVNSHVVLLVESLGRLEGKAVRVRGSRFAVQFEPITERRRVRLADTLIWEINRAKLGLVDDREAKRRGKTGAARVRLSDGVEANGDYIDISDVGVSLASIARPRAGEAAEVEERRGRVARLHDRGFAVAFDAKSTDQPKPSEASPEPGD
jgi:hypothetical protein